MSKIIYPQSSYKVQGVIYDVYNKLGPVWNEEVYEKSMILGLQDENLKVEAQKQLQVLYKEQIIGLYRPDIIVEDKIILELKAVPEIIPLHQAQIISYLKATEFKLGILINFGDKNIYFKRYAYESANIKIQSLTSCPLNVDLLYPELSRKILNALLEVHSILGSGFHCYIYRRATWREFRLKDIPFLLVKKIKAKYRGLAVGERDVKVFIVNEKIIVWVLTANKIHDLHEKKLKKYLKHFNLKLGIVVNFNSKSLTWNFVRTNSR